MIGFYSGKCLKLFALTSFHIKSGNNTEKIWAHRFLAKPKTIETGGLGGAVWGPGRCLDYNEECIVWRPPIGSRAMPW